MRIKQSFGSHLFDTINILFMLALVFVMLYPIWFVSIASISNPLLVIKGEITLWPRQMTLIAYERVLSDPYIWLTYWNTVKYTVLQVAATLLCTSLLAYPLAKRRLPLRRPILFLIAFTMLFSGGLIPTFLVVKSLGMLNTTAAMIIPSLISTWYLFIMRSFFEALPEELEEAATIDGCGPISTFFRIVLPLSLPVIMTIGLYTAVSQWNAFFEALIYLNSRDMFPLQIHLRNVIIAGSSADEFSGTGVDAVLVHTVKYATIMVATLPILFVYPFIQKYFIQGTMIGSVKG